MTGHYNEAGGYFAGIEPTPGQSSGPVTRQQFLCPVTARQVLEAGPDGVKIGSKTMTMLSLAGIVSDIDATATNIKFSLCDDTGKVDCLEWIEANDEIKDQKLISNIQENTYYHVYGCFKNVQGNNRVMVFKTTPITDFNEITAFMLEVLYGYSYLENQMMMTALQTHSTTKNEFNPFQMQNVNDTAFTPIQKALMDAIKNVASPIGWSKYDPEMRKQFSARQIEDAVDFLVGEGHIYTTVDDDHFAST